MSIRKTGVKHPYTEELVKFSLGNRYIDAIIAYLRNTQDDGRRIIGVAHDVAHERLAQENLEDTIIALANAMSYLHPYTATHQSRVAHLAETIARKLRFNEDRIHWLKLAASVHDIGKIKIPAEILNFPGRLTPIEFELVKTHAEIGYNILKDISFPAPVAQMVYQHHEYLDGSGYPRQLKGEDILLESRIITVADIVEAMSSDRPYRPARGIDVALEQITLMRGQQLDCDVVDACINLFKTEQYQIRG